MRQLCDMMKKLLHNLSGCCAEAGRPYVAFEFIYLLSTMMKIAKILTYG